MKQIVSVLMFLSGIALMLPAAGKADTPRPELRAFWADGFNPGYKSPQEVDELLQRLHAAHCNAVFAQMRKRGDAYYQSRYEPWASDDPTHFDALAYLIQKAHAMNPPIAVHAWINTCAVGGGAGNPFNIVHLHRDWLSLDPKGADYDGEATKIDPGNPGAADWTFRIYLDVARHYDLDGIHFDFVRYGGRDWGYNPVSVARFRQQYAGAGYQRLPGSYLPAPTDPLWQQWRRDQVTELVRKVYAQAVKINPRIVVSASVIAWADGPKTEEEWFTKSAAMHRVYQDWRGWLQEGILDLACPMTYFQAPAHTDWQQDWSEFTKNHQYHRASAVAVGTWFNTIPESLALMQIARQKSARRHWPYGVMLYSYAGTNTSEEKDAQGKRQELQYQPDFYAALSQPSRFTTAPPFPTDVPLPPMPWKTAPRLGIVKGFVLTPQFDPVDGATVSVQSRGKNRFVRTDGTGFYAIIDLPPGKFTVRVTAPGYEKQTATATVNAGGVTTVPFTLGGASIPLTRSLVTLQLDRTPPPNGTPVRLENLRVTLGSDTFPGNLYVTDAHGQGVRVRLAAPPDLPFQPGDVVSVVGALRTVEGEPTIDQAVVRLTDMLPLSALPAPLPTSGSKILSGEGMLTGVPVRVQGSVAASGPDGFTLDDGTRMEVTLTGRKDFGVEATGFSLTPPAVGSQVSVIGIACRVRAGEGQASTIRIRPLRADDVTLLPAVSTWRQAAAQGGALALFR